MSGKTGAVSETKVVINADFGGFSLSLDARREYLRRAGIEWTEKPSGWSSTFGPLLYVDGHVWSERDLDRTDPILVALVEEWGDRAAGMYASLEVETLPAGTLYRIHEYDGLETIETRDGIDWTTA